MKPGTLVTHTHIIKSRIFMVLGPVGHPPDHGRLTRYQAKMLKVVEMGDPTFTKLRFHESYLREIEE
jgi:hypothetical protein